MDIDLTEFRLSDDALKEYVKAIVENIKMRERHGLYQVTMDRLIVIELVARELERNAKKGGNGDA